MENKTNSYEKTPLERFDEELKEIEYKFMFGNKFLPMVFSKLIEKYYYDIEYKGKTFDLYLDKDVVLVTPGALHKGMLHSISQDSKFDSYTIINADGAVLLKKRTNGK